MQAAPPSPTPEPREAHRGLALAALAAVLASVWLRPGPAILYGTDAGCYARVAREMAERPLSQWPRITLGGQDFFEHPPLAMWLESALFRLLGATADSALLLARLQSTALVLIVFLLARRLAGTRVAAFCVASLLLLAGFHYESQNPMLELPLTVWLACAALGTVLLRTSLVGGSLLVALGFTAALFTKGPPALAVFPLLAWSGWRGGVRWAQVAWVTVIALAVAALAVAGFEAARQAQGLEPFFPRYLRHQVLASVAEGRHSPQPSPFYYLTPLKRWHLAALLVLPLSGWAWYRRRREPVALLVECGWVFAATIVIGFSLPVQKYQWYIHPTMPGSAWFMGPALALLLPVRLERPLPWLAAAYVAVQAVFAWWVPPKRSDIGAEFEVVHRTPAPPWPAGKPLRVAHCGGLSEWQSEHLFAFLWSAQWAPCEGPAELRFDGQQLRPW